MTARVTTLVLVSLMLSCTGPLALPGAPTASPASRVVRSAAEAVILQPQDVPARYVVETDERMSDEALADGLGISTGLIKERGATGHLRAYKEPSDPFVCCIIDSILITTASPGAARAVFGDYRKRASELGSVDTDLGETVGEESQALVFQQSTTDGELITVSVLFRYANVVDAVEVTGRPGSFERAYVLEFAKKQLTRLRADAERT